MSHFEPTSTLSTFVRERTIDGPPASERDPSGRRIWPNDARQQCLELAARAEAAEGLLAEFGHRIHRLQAENERLRIVREPDVKNADT